jgi:Protein kinase domain
MNDRDLVPDRLGAYRLLDRIGEGGMGVVYLARDLGHRTVALKVLRSSVAGDPTARRRLAREVETMQRVHSPHVAEVIDADLTSETPYIVTRFVPGRTLDDLVTESGPLRGAALAQLACGLADALVAVHAAGVVHRDLKPSNIMLVHDTPVVIDFGIAQGPDATRLTITGMFMGTPGYLAPEVIEGRPSSEASDVHAWGATVGYAATGRPPFGTGSYETIFYRIVNGQADLDGAPPALVPLLASALARDPAYRPPALQLRAQAGVLDPAALVPGPVTTGTPGAAPGLNGAGATRSDVAPGRAAATAPPGLAAAGAVAAGPLAGGLPSANDLPTATANGALAGGGGAAAGVTALPGAAGPPVPARPAGFDPGMTVAPPEERPPWNPPGPHLPPHPPSPGLSGKPPGPTAQVANAAVFAPVTRPITTARPLPDDLRDVLTPVRYVRGGSKKRDAGTAAGPAAGAPPAAGVAPDEAGAAGQSRWQPVLVFASILVVASVAVVLPIAGTVAALAFFAALRTAGLVQRRSTARRLARGTKVTDPLVTAVSLPWFLVRALIALLLLAPLALAAAGVAAGAAVAVTAHAWPGRALACAAGALVLCYGFGPGSGLPRTQLRRVFGRVARTRGARVVVLAGMTALVAAAVTAAVTWPSVYWPTAVPHGLVQFGVNHFGPLRRLSYHLRVAHHIHIVRGFLLRHLAQLRSTG